MGSPCGRWGSCWVVAVLALACGSSGGGGVPCPDGGSCTSGGAGGSGNFGGSAGLGGAGGADSCPVIPENSAFCSSSTPPVGTCTSPPPACDPNRPVHACCVAVGAPGKDGGFLTRTTATKEFSDPSGGPVNLGCFSPAGYPPKPSPGGTVTLTGRIRVAANGGCDPGALLGASIQVYTVLRTGDPATDGMPGAQVGPTLLVDDAMPTVSELVDNKCPDDTRISRVYTFPGVPLDTELLIKTSGDTYATVYMYNVFPSTGDPHFDAANSTYTEDILLLAKDDFTIWPTAAIGKTIGAGEGMVFGEVHDCGDIRLENATVDVSSNRAGLKYVDDSEDNPLPNLSRVGTGKLSMFLALDMEPGFVRVSATGLAGSTLSSIGYSDVRVFPDAATHVKLRGLRGFQVP